MLFAYLLVGLLFSPVAALFGYDWWLTVAISPAAFVLDALVAGLDPLIRKRRFNFILVDLAVFLVLLAGVFIYDPPTLEIPIAICLAIYGLVVLSMFLVLKRRGRLAEYWTSLFQGLSWTRTLWPWPF